MKPTLQIRAARPLDASFAAPLIYLSLNGLADHLFQRDAETIERMISKLFARNAGRFGYGHAFIAEHENISAGIMIASFGRDLNRQNLQTAHHLITVLGFKNGVRFIQRGITLPGGPEAYDDEFFISNLGISPSMQGRSFGSQMLAYAEELALGHNLAKCSLIVGSDNTNAKRLYERVGYQVVETVRDDNKHIGYYRMIKVL